MLRNVCWYWWLYGCHTTDAAPAPSDEAGTTVTTGPGIVSDEERDKPPHWNFSPEKSKHWHGNHLSICRSVSKT